jgi:hypothetical protein
MADGIDAAVAFPCLNAAVDMAEVYRPTEPSA